MGTTMSFYQILNKGFSPESLQKKLENASAFAHAKTEKTAKILEDYLSPDLYRQMMGQFHANAANFPGIPGAEALSRPNRTVIAYKESAVWLPFFEENLCEGYIASSRDAERLSEIFEVPVMAFAVFDSDVFFVSYGDAANQITCNYAKPNSEGFDEFDTELYSTAFPEFLLEFCSRDELKTVWDRPDETFADDRMGEIAQLLQMELMYDSSHIPEGYQGIYAASGVR